MMTQMLLNYLKTHPNLKILVASAQMLLKCYSNAPQMLLKYSKI